MEVKFKFGYGDLVTNTIAGSTGVVMGVTQHQFTGSMYLVQPRCKGDVQHQLPTWMNGVS